MSDDLVKRLRSISTGMPGHVDAGIVWDAADRIASLNIRAEKAEAENKRLREALEPFDQFGRELIARNHESSGKIATLTGRTNMGWVEMSLTFKAFLNLRAALERNDG